MESLARLLANFGRLRELNPFRLGRRKIALGLLGAMAVAGGLSALLFGVQPLDPATFLLTAALLAVVAVAAAAVPALRAARVDPAIALRDE